MKCDEGRKLLPCKSEVLFTSIGADHGIDQEKQALKVLMELQA